MADRSLTASFGANTTGFISGIEKVKRELTVLNAQLSENKQKVKEVNKEISDLGKRQSSLASKMAGGGSAAQKEAMEALKQKIASANEKLGQLKANESELKAKIAATNGELKNQVANLDSNTKSTGLLEKALGKLGATAKAFISIYGAKKLWDVLIGSNAEMEQYQTSFEVMLGDAEKAKQMIEDLRELAAKTPLAMSDVISSGTLLMNYGVDDSNLIGTMTKLG